MKYSIDKNGISTIQSLFIAFILFLPISFRYAYYPLCFSIPIYMILFNTYKNKLSGIKISLFILLGILGFVLFNNFIINKGFDNLPNYSSTSLPLTKTTYPYWGNLKKIDLLT